MRKKDIFISLIIGEISAWLIVVLAGSLLSVGTYQKYSTMIMVVLPIVFPIVCAAALFIAYLISKKIPVVLQIAKFILVGGFNTLVDWGVLALVGSAALLYFRISAKDMLFSVFSVTITYYVLFKAISFIISATNSYPWNKLWTFKRAGEGNAGKEFAQFLTVSTVGLFINVGIAALIFQTFVHISVLTEGQWTILSAAIATVISMTWNFLGYKFIVFDVKKPVQPFPVQPRQNEPPVMPPRKFV